MTESSRVVISESDRLSLVTLGGASLIVSPDQRLLLGPGKPLALITYLALSPGRTATREFLTGLLWADMDSDRARHALRQTVWQLRQLLGEDTLIGRDEIRLSTTIASDRDAFLAAVERGDFEAAVDLYTGPFLPDLATPGGVEFEQWADIERDRLRATFLRACEVVTRRRLSSSQVREAQRIARRARDEDPHNELGWRLLLESLVSGEDFISASLEADALEAFAAGEHGSLEPSTRTIIRVARQVAASDQGPSRQELVVDLIGREREFTAIVDAAERARKGPASHIHVVAPAGLGKTRLLHDAEARLRATGWRVVHIRAHPGERQIAYALAGEMARNIGDLPGASGVSPASASALVALMPVLSSRLAAPPDPAVGDDALRHRTVALNEAITAAAEEAPFALFIDDLHWADSSSRRVLEGLLSRIDGARVAIVTTTRPMREAFTAAEDTRVLHLQPLTEAQVASFVTSMGSLPEDVPWCAGFVRGLTLATKGAPLLLLEMLKLGIERGTLSLDEGGWSCHDRAALAAQLREGQALRNRMDPLSRERRWVVTLLAIAGIPLTASQLARAAGRDPMAVEDDLEALERLGLVRRSHDGWDLGHDEVGTVALEGLGDEARQSADRGIGRALAESAPGDGQLVLVRAARHLAAAGDDATLGPLARRFIRMARANGDDRPPSLLVAELVGESDEPGLRRRLLRRLPLHWRLGLWSRPRMVATAAVVLSACVALLALALAPAPPRPDAQLLLVVPGPDSVAQLHVYDVGLAGWTAQPLHSSRTELLRSPVLSMAYASGSLSPDGSRWAYSTATDEVHTDELFLVTPAGETRLTEEPRDDLMPRWSPDGRSIAFLTARWSTPGADDYDVAIMDTSGGSVRRVTSGDAWDIGLAWSPDGTRLAVLRRYRELRDQAVCWTTFDGSRERCLTIPGFQPGIIAGWLDLSRILVLADAGGHSALLTLNLDTGAWQPLAEVSAEQVTLSPDGRWAACRCAWEAEGSPELWVWPASDPGHRRRVEGSPRGGFLAWRQPDGVRYLDQLEFGHRPLAASTGSTIRPVLRAEQQNGESLPLPRSVLAWAVADSSIARIDTLSGEVRAVRAGTTVITVSAGGWRATSTTITVTEDTLTMLTSERWDAGWSTRWTAWGKPIPTVESGPDGIAGLANNGDGVYSSGVYSKPFDPSRGLGVEVMVSSPITQSYWQAVSLLIRSTRYSSAEDAVTRAMDPPVDRAFEAEICGAGYPGGEGLSGIERLSAVGGGKGVPIPVDSTLANGRWFRLRVQVFQDGTCGVAVNGRPLWRSTARVPLDQRYRIWIAGNSANTRILAGPLEVWSGVKRDVEWTVVGGSGR
jgi:DNA-binding SARP family transcriptional activator/DNA-binding transcriptional ArsR family regulator